nr:hypothetical protein [Nanoarchaeota archaeon]
MKVIGLAGPSCSGKSNVTRVLEQRLTADVLCLDEFYIKDSKKIFINYQGKRFRSFERPGLYNGNQLAKYVKELKDNGKIRFKSLNIKSGEYKERELIRKDFLILEGFLLFYYTKLRRLIDYRFYIDIPSEEAVSRRMARVDRPLSDASFVKIGCKEYQKYGVPQKALPRVIILDGTLSVKDISKKIISIVLK